MKWEISISEFDDKEGRKYKVTRRLPEFGISETKLFKTKKSAKKQFEYWLNQ